MSNTQAITDMEDAVHALRERLESFAAAQDEHSDEANEDAIQETGLALDNLEAAISALVP